MEIVKEDKGKKMLTKKKRKKNYCEEKKLKKGCNIFFSLRFFSLAKRKLCKDYVKLKKKEEKNSGKVGIFDFEAHNYTASFTLFFPFS